MLIAHHTCTGVRLGFPGVPAGVGTAQGPPAPPGLATVDTVPLAGCRDPTGWQSHRAEATGLHQQGEDRLLPPEPLPTGGLRGTTEMTGLTCHVAKLPS